VLTGQPKTLKEAAEQLGVPYDDLSGSVAMSGGPQQTGAAAGEGSGPQPAPGKSTGVGVGVTIALLAVAVAGVAYWIRRRWAGAGSSGAKVGGRPWWQFGGGERSSNASLPLSSQLQGGGLGVERGANGHSSAAALPISSSAAAPVQPRISGPPMGGGMGQRHLDLNQGLGGRHNV